MVHNANNLVEFFQLKHVYEIIDEKIKFLKENIRVLEKYTCERRRKPFRIEPINLVILVWGRKLRLDVRSTDEDFLILATLIRWFDEHTRWAEYFDWQSHFSDKTVKLTFLKYIKHRKRKNSKKTKSISYLYLVEFLRLECFSDEVQSHTKDLLPTIQELQSMKERGIYEPTDSLLSD